MLLFNSVYFVYAIITNYKIALEGFTICTHTTSLSQEITSDQKKLPRNRRKKTFTGKIKGRNLQESNSGGSLPPDGRMQ